MKRDRGLTLTVAVLVVFILGILTWAFLDQRSTNRQLVANSEDQIAASKAQVKALRLADQKDDQRAEEHRKETRRNLRTVIRSLREIVRQLGGDPSGIPPQDHSGSGTSPEPNPDNGNGQGNGPPGNGGGHGNGNGGNGGGGGGGEPGPLDPLCEITGLC